MATAAPLAEPKPNAHFQGGGCVIFSQGKYGLAYGGVALTTRENLHASTNGRAQQCEHIFLHDHSSPQKARRRASVAFLLCLDKSTLYIVILFVDGF